MSIPLPTETELALLNVLWTRGPSTVREVHEALDREHPVGYTTVLKMLQIMTEKGLVRRDTSARAHVYEPAPAQDRIEQRLVGDLLKRVFGGSTERLMLQALSSKEASPEELAAIRDLLNQIDNRS